MSIILGIDAAWTVNNPSGVALLDTARRGAMCLLAAPSYAAFIDAAKGGTIHWDAKQPGGDPPVAALLMACEALVGSAVDVVAIDMPVSKAAIVGRREADQAVARLFGSRYCSTHTPNASRPGPLGAALTEAFRAHGYPVATTATPSGEPRHLLEVYPHPALLALLKRNKRVPYKAAKTRRYWPSETLKARRELLLHEWRVIETALSNELGPLPFTTPVETDLPARILKSYEDALDAVISAWVGMLYLEKRTSPLGDNTAAVWCPLDVIAL